jgi:hypothetical protein
MDQEGSPKNSSVKEVEVVDLILGVMAAAAGGSNRLRGFVQGMG